MCDSISQAHYSIRMYKIYFAAQHKDIKIDVSHIQNLFR